jgi:hypothetical protein
MTRRKLASTSWNCCRRYVRNRIAGSQNIHAPL